MAWGFWSGGRCGLLAVAAVAAALALGGPAVAGQAGGDFNGDKRHDLAVGVSNEDVDGAGDAGAVNVLYGTDNGLRAGGDQFWHQGNAGGGETPEALDRFGEALAVGDFDHDGYDDLAVGVPGEMVGIVRNAGAVNVLCGSADGLAADRT